MRNLRQAAWQHLVSSQGQQQQTANSTEQHVCPDATVCISLTSRDAGTSGVSEFRQVPQLLPAQICNAFVN